MAVSANKDKVSSVDNAISQIQRQFGKGSIMRLGSRETENIPVVPTGALSLDIALGVGGIPKGTNHRDLWTGILRQDDPCAPCRG